MTAGAIPRPHTALVLLFGCWAAALATAPTIEVKAALAAPAVLLPLAGWTLAVPGRWVSLFLVTALLLPPLPIALGDSGPHPCLLFAALGVWSGALGSGRWRLQVGGVGAAMLALLGVMLASMGPAAVNSGVEVAAGSLARVGLFGIGVFLFLFTAGMTERGLPGVRALYACAVGAALFACVDFYFQLPAPAGYGPQFVWLESGVFRRAQGLFYEASTLGNFCMFFLVMIAVAWTRPRDESPVSRKWLAAGGSVLFAALVLSYSRASVVGFAVAMAVLLWWHRERIRVGRTIVVAAAALCIAALLVWQLFPQFAEMYWRRLEYSTELVTDGTESVLSGRAATWRTLAAWVADNPGQTMLGIGYKTLPYTEHLGTPLVADNMYLSLLVETGVAGLAALVWLNWSILRAAARAARSADAQRAFCGLWMLCFWWGESVQMASGDLLTYWRVLPVYFFVLALAVRE